MWPWKSQPKVYQLSRDLEDRLARVERTQEEQATAWRKVKLEWEDVYDRLERIVGRINARARKERVQPEGDGDQPREMTLEEINAAIREGTFPTPPQVRRS